MGKRITGEQRVRLASEVKQAYEGGASIRVLARAQGRSYGFMHDLLREAGAVFRARGGNTRPGRPA
ncbi:helix-turn-helix domain-containing protein [Streptomyces sp. NPDC005386]|uniref:helix-turn-helix domain-containing protein n=1 Tax=Streptomyces sp. NPDC005386 TaxID=3154562 RepID=UPI0033AF31E5